MTAWFQVWLFWMDAFFPQRVIREAEIVVLPRSYAEIRRQRLPVPHRCSA